jgi:hypothetical protein
MDTCAGDILRLPDLSVGIEKRKNMARKAYVLQAPVVAMAVVGIAAIAPGSASATPSVGSGWSTPDEIRKGCAIGTDVYCDWKSRTKEAVLGPHKQVTKTMYNCSSSPATQAFSWTDTTGTTTTIGVKIGIGIDSIIKADFEAHFEQSWMNEHSESETDQLTVPENSVGWIEHAQVMRKVSGTWNTFDQDSSPYPGGWKKVYADDVITAPAPEGEDGKHRAVLMKSRAMTDDEKKECGNHRDRVFLK